MRSGRTPAWNASSARQNGEKPWRPDRFPGTVPPADSRRCLTSGMASIPVYALESDLQTIVDFLNQDPEIAFVIPDGPHRWRTVDRMPQIAAGHHALWLRAGEALPLVGSSQAEPDTPILNPDAGWKERLPSAVPGQPFFGSHPGVIWLHVSTGGPGLVPMSAFGWIGNRYRAIGHGAAPAASKWWRRLQRWIRKQGPTVPRGSLQASGPVDVAAFPAALMQLRNGVPGELNPPAT